MDIHYKSNLHAIMQEHGMTGDKLAAAVKMSPKHISLMRRGKIVPYRENAERVASALDVAVTDIWPDYETINADRAAKNNANLDLGRGITKKAKTSRGLVYELQREIRRYAGMRQHMAGGGDNVLPVVEGGAMPEFHIIAAPESNKNIEDPQWCRKKASDFTNYLLSHMPWGVYKIIREQMYFEHAKALEREAAAAAAEVTR